jgi:hypothetical protein
MYKLKVLLTGLGLSGMMANSQGYRTIGRERFRIIDTTGFYVYSVTKLVQGEKIARPQDVYYFSVREDGPLLELTRENLEEAFADNAKFRYALEAQFHSDKQLMAYDHWLKTYKLKYIYSQSSN